MAKAKLTTIERLRSDLTQILTEYGKEVEELTFDAVKTVTKSGVKAVKGNSRGTFGGTGKYASGWTSQIATGRFSAQGTIYNAKTPGLPHLLENGHAKRGGGRVPGRTHIAPVEIEVSQAIEKAIEMAVTK